MAKPIPPAAPAPVTSATLPATPPMPHLPALPPRHPAPMFDQGKPRPLSRPAFGIESMIFPCTRNCARVPRAAFPFAPQALI